jgi:MarR family 2-MHQ and catechol resistance regulon transcriptional repressor
MPSHFKGTDNQQRALDAYIKLVRASDSVLTSVQKTFIENKLTLSQFGVLDALLHLGPMCQSVLAEKILKSSGNMTMVIDNLEKRNLVKRYRDDTDRRKVTVHLTPTGKRLIEGAMPGHVRLIEEAFASLSDRELEQLAKLTKKLGVSLGRQVASVN